MLFISTKDVVKLTVFLNETALIKAVKDRVKRSFFFVKNFNQWENSLSMQ